MLIVRHAKWQIWFVVELNSVKIWQLFHFKYSFNILPAYFIKFELFSEFQKFWSNYKKIYYSSTLKIVFCFRKWFPLKYVSFSSHTVLKDGLYLTHSWVTNCHSNTSQFHIMLFYEMTCIWLIFEWQLSTQIWVILTSCYLKDDLYLTHFWVKCHPLKYKSFLSHISFWKIRWVVTLLR